MITSERTPLVGSPPAPSYVFAARQRRARLRKFQCCICATILAIFGLALVITVSYGIEHPDDLDNITVTEVSNLTDAQIALPILLQLSWPRNDAIPKNWSGKALQQDIDKAGEAGAEALRFRQRWEAAKGRGLRPGSPEHRAQLALAGTRPSLRLASAAYAADYATRFYVSNKTRGKDWCVGKGPKINASWTLQECHDPVWEKCEKSKYRTINGTCNNLDHPKSWGVAFIPFRRSLAQSYADGVSSPRKASDGSELPSARQVSIQVHRPIYRADPDFTVVVAVWGQFLDHDITATALSQGANGTSISCCSDFNTPGTKMHPECFPVILGPGDPNYEKYNITCMDFVRSAPAQSCYLGPREQMNQATAFIDGSTVYGPYNELADSLRTFSNGELRMMITQDGRELLPVSTDPNDGCNDKKLTDQGKYCFMSGDVRANENLHLTTMHLLWSRQHNRLARKLRELNPHWNDETLFQEARRIVAAQMQHITYNEFLTVILGERLMTKMDLLPKKYGYSSGYNSSLDPSIANHFASSAFRFAHTLLPTLMKVINNQTDSAEWVHLHKMLFNPYSLYGFGGADNAMRGAMTTLMQRVDPYFTAELTANLFKRDTPPDDTESKPEVTTGSKPIVPCGLDLVSLNIQRGRDHGLPSYPSWREHCGFKKPRNFKDLEGVIDRDSLKRISTIFKRVEDVDLYTAALSEVPIEGSVLGATVTCLLLDQFVRLKRADRFWYESPEQPQAFSEDQLHEIRKTTLAGVICRNGDNLERAQKYVMKSVSETNPLVKCNSIPDADLTPWVETMKKLKLSSSDSSEINVKVISRKV